MLRSRAGAQLVSLNQNGTFVIVSVALLLWLHSGVASVTPSPRLQSHALRPSFSRDIYPVFRYTNLLCCVCVLPFSLSTLPITIANYSTTSLIVISLVIVKTGCHCCESVSPALGVSENPSLVKSQTFHPLRRRPNLFYAERLIKFVELSRYPPHTTVTGMHTDKWTALYGISMFFVINERERFLLENRTLCHEHSHTWVQCSPA